MSLVYLAPVSWDSHSQRPHELVRYFHACTGGKVLWVDPYPTRLPCLDDILHPRPRLSGDCVDPPAWLSVVTPKALPIEPIPFSGLINRLGWRDVVSSIEAFSGGGPTILGIGKPSSLALQLLSRNIFHSSFYDAMDDFPAFYRGLSRLSMMNRHRRVACRVSTVLASCTSLCDRLRSAARDVRLVLNGCAADRLPELKPRAPETRGTPVIGYLGTIASWFDWDLVRLLADAHPEARVRLIGPLCGRRPEALPPNVGLEPPLSHADALKTMADFDVGLIPFRKTTLTASVDPIKYYEYRAMGLPVVSSEFGEMGRRGHEDAVFLIGEAAEPSSALEGALAWRPSPERTAQFRCTNSWEQRFERAGVFGL